MRTKLYLIIIFIFIALPFVKGQVTLVEWNFPNTSADSLVDVASTSPNNMACVITPIGGTTGWNYKTFLGASPLPYSFCAYASSGWNGGAGTKGWEINFSTIGCHNLDVSSKQQSSGTGPRDFKIQYKIGVSGIYYDLPGATVKDSANMTSGVINCIALLPICENQPSVYLRWVMSTNTSVNNGTVAAGGTSRIDDIVVNCNSIGYYRTIKSGKWKDKTVWQYSPDNIIPYIPADTTPTYASKTITIQNGHTVVIDSSSYYIRTCNFTIDEVTINFGGALHINGGYVYFNDELLALVDINVNGELMDSLSYKSIPNSLGYINWIGSSKWILGATGTFVKTQHSTNDFFQNNYAGGIITIPPTAKWILRKTGYVAPSMNTVGMYYPTFILENTTGTIYDAKTVNTPATSNFFSGNSPCTIYGDFIINSSGLNAIIFYDSIATNSLLIKGNIIINSSGNFILEGDSLSLEGDLTVNGNMNYSTTIPNARKFIFSGSNNQTVNPGIGNISFYNLEINKSANNVAFSKSVFVDKNLNFKNGFAVTSNANNIVFTDAATASGYTNASYVQGPCIKTGTAAFTFPVGKANNVQPLSISASAGAVAFWTEDFNNGCNSGCTADAYSNANGAWTLSDFGPSTACGFAVEPNEWFVSCSENGNAVGLCGTSCAGNATLHVGSTSLSPHNSVACPTGDCGATYDSGGNCDIAGTGASTETDKQIESPLIDCSSQSNITLSFKYLAVGTVTDTASLWFSDGASGWEKLTTFTSQFCFGGKGLWRTYSVQLPQTADFNPDVQIAFRWNNDDNGVGATSFAVDDITLAASDEFRAEYFGYTNPQLLFGNNLQAGIDHISACEYWDLSRTRGLSNRQLTLGWNSKSCGVDNYTDLVIARYNGGANQWQNNGGTAFTGNNTAGTVSSSGFLNSFCPYTLASTTGLNPLPISLLNFSATAVSESVIIKWQTGSEPDNAFFEIQKSKDLVTSYNLEKVVAKGNATNGASYKIVDYEPFNGLSYYRLKQTDKNGNFTFSKWESVKFEKQIDPALVASVANGVLDFSLLNCCQGQLHVKIVDLFGRIVFQNQITNQVNNHINLNTTASGVYILFVESTEGNFTQKFVY